MISATSHNLDFDYLTSLAQSDPSAFEHYRAQAIEDYISTLPKHRQMQMRRLQWRIDRMRERHSPMGVCVKLSGMMWDHLLGPQGLMGLLGQGKSPSSEQNDCVVIPFPAGCSH